MTDRLKLDRYDLAILQKLQQEGRITKVALAEAVNLSSSPCWERLRRLEDAGYITGYQANLNLRKLAPVTEVMVEVSLANHQAADFKRFETAILEVSEKSVRTGFEPVGEIVKHSFKTGDERAERRELVTGIPTGFLEFDEMTSGLQRSDLIIGAARPAM